MASPRVAGAAALYLAAYPGSTPAQVRNGLFSLATKGIVTSASTSNNHLLNVSGLPGAPTPPPNTPPTASFTFACTGLTCSFTDQGTDSDGSVVARAWTFGDGGSGNGANVSRTYASAGSYEVELTVTDDDGATATQVNTVSVSEPPRSPPPATILLSASARGGKGPNRVDLTWAGATASSIDVYRNGVLVATVANSGSYTDHVGKKRGTYEHQVCHAGTTTCSNTVSTTF